jgi:hypothetical protein
MRCLKRRLSDIVYRQMARDAQRLAAGPGGHTGAATNSSAADLTPTASPSEQSLPRPANHHPRTPTSSTSTRWKRALCSSRIVDSDGLPGLISGWMTGLGQPGPM